MPPRREPLRNSFRTLRAPGQRWERPPLAATRMNSRNNGGGVLAAVLVQQVDQVLAVLVGEREGGDGDGVVVFDQDQPAGSGGGGGPPAAHLERVDPGVLGLEPYVQTVRTAALQSCDST